MGIIRESRLVALGIFIEIWRPLLDAMNSGDAQAQAAHGLYYRAKCRTDCYYVQCMECFESGVFSKIRRCPSYSALHRKSNALIPSKVWSEQDLMDLLESKK